MKKQWCYIVAAASMVFTHTVCFGAKIFAPGAVMGCSEKPEEAVYDYQADRSKKWYALVDSSSPKIVETRFLKSEKLMPRSDKAQYFIEANAEWYALVDSLSPKIVETRFLKSGKLIPRSGKALFFIEANAGVNVGTVVPASIRLLLHSAKFYSERKISFAGKSWNWLEWGGIGEFYIFDGVVKLTSSLDDGGSSFMKQKNISLPKNLGDSPDYQYTPVWAGDLNGDGLLDIIVSWTGNEVWGYDLWLGKKSQSGSQTFKRTARTGLYGCA
ncbi:hypothetical protein ACO0K9_27460 [Undibacterium sp. Ji50W]|uniref:hypothetical protein n=1 Tax=Undibacterium sp. Ji50W TaxID=3413041 RepID=UPI003BF036F2